MRGGSPGGSQRAGERDEPGGAGQSHMARHAAALQHRDLLAALDSLHKHFDYHSGELAAQRVSLSTECFGDRTSRLPACLRPDVDNRRQCSCALWTHVGDASSRSAAWRPWVFKQSVIHCWCRRRHRCGSRQWRRRRRGRLPARAAQPGGDARALRPHHAGPHQPQRDCAPLGFTSFSAGSSNIVQLLSQRLVMS